MGRRSVALPDRARWVFNRLAAAYRGRPDYPAPLVERLASLARERGGRVVDVGAGVGHLAIPLAARGLAVVAVEPAVEMLAALEEARPRRPDAALNVRTVHAAAEATGLAAACADLVVVADALHWFDPERAGLEAARILRPGGAVAVVEAAFAPTPFMTALAALLARANPKTRPRPPGALRQFVALATATPRGSAPRVVEERFDQEVALDGPALEALLRSMSHVGPALGPARLREVIDEAAALGRACGGARLSRQLTLRWATRRSSS